jgi:hypothetical protein
VVAVALVPAASWELQKQHITREQNQQERQQQHGGATPNAALKSSIKESGDLKKGRAEKSPR